MNILFVLNIYAQLVKCDNSSEIHDLSIFIDDEEDSFENLRIYLGRIHNIFIYNLYFSMMKYSEIFENTKEVVDKCRDIIQQISFTYEKLLKKCSNELKCYNSKEKMSVKEKTFFDVKHEQKSFYEKIETFFEPHKLEIREMEIDFLDYINSKTEIKNV
ncbi:putative SP-containing protein [Vairimorpha necatrix]|uniref:SP-containing protein n=1 Tax=Vairimorpha necatrix TaxID=6039 RepID=A0AAX4J9G9_9MICR